MTNGTKTGDSKGFDMEQRRRRQWAVDFMGFLIMFKTIIQVWYETLP